MSRRKIEPCEDLLRGLPLRWPSPELDRRVEAVWRARPVPWKRLGLGGAVAALALAAGLWLMTLLPFRGDDQASTRRPGAADRPRILSGTTQPFAPSTPNGRRQPPIRVEQVWTTPAGDEIIVPSEGLPIRRQRHRVIRHVRWIDERGNVRIEWRIPSEEILDVPLPYN